MTMTASEAARYFLALQDDEDSISNLKLQKLLYYAQGFSLALTGKPLFNDQIKAWIHGPVVPSVWADYRECGAGPVPRPLGLRPRCSRCRRPWRDRRGLLRLWPVLGLAPARDDAR